MLASLRTFVLPLCAVFFLPYPFLLLFSLFLLFPISLWTSFFVIMSFSRRYLVLSPQFLLRFVHRTLKEYDVHLIRTYYVGTLTSLFVFRLKYGIPGTILRSMLLCLWRALSFFYFVIFSSWGNRPLLHSWWSLSCDHGWHFSDKFMWEQQQ